MTSIWIVTKDIRIEDNNVLKTCLLNSEIVYPVFIIDNQQVLDGGCNSLHFMIESLQVLNDFLKQIGSCLNAVFKENLVDFVRQNNITNAYILKGFTPFEKQRNQYYSTLFNLTEIDDTLGREREFFLKSDGTNYHVFSPYCRSILNKGGLILPDLSIPVDINKCKIVPNTQIYDYLSLKQFLTPKPPEAEWIGGFIEGKSICIQRWENLQIFLSGNGIKHKRKDISPHVKFGTVSPRLVYHCGLVEEHQNDTFKEHVEGKGILWRALYYNLMDKGELVLKPRNVIWNEESNYFNLWCNGNTGFDFVDAGIHQLLRTGTMDNELRMLTANFLVFVYNINWRNGESFFRYHLVDYDWPLNIGNWAWAAQIGIDNPSPNRTYGGKPIRIFNPDTYKTKTKAERDYRNNFINKWLMRPQGSLQKSCDFYSSISHSLNFY